MTFVLGITGGIGSGKSTVAEAFAHCGALVLDADRRAREVTETEEVREELRASFGVAIFDGCGQLDRAALAERVFGPDQKSERERLEAIIHPAVRASLGAELEAARRSDVPLVVLDVPLLWQSPFRDDCQAVLHIETRREDRLARIVARGWAPEELDRREAAQLSLDEKRRRADHVLTNSGELAELQHQVARLYDTLTSDPDGVL